jgi:hypothetical protein
MTTSYARHKAIDDGLATLLSAIDRFVEVYIGEGDTKNILILEYLGDTKNILEYLGDTKKRLSKLDTRCCRDLTSIILINIHNTLLNITYSMILRSYSDHTWVIQKKG